MKLLVINGPNLNMIGIREPDIYGARSYRDLEEMMRRHAAARGHEIEMMQSNYEGELLDRIQQAYFDGVEGIVINPAAYTHTSIALLDALKAVGIPAVEDHISNVSGRESFRQVSFVREACIATVEGKGLEGYIEAVGILEKHLNK